MRQMLWGLRFWNSLAAGSLLLACTRPETPLPSRQQSAWRTSIEPPKSAPVPDPQPTSQAPKRVRKRSTDVYGPLASAYDHLRLAGAEVLLSGVLLSCSETAECLSNGLCSGYAGDGCVKATADSCRSAAPCDGDGLCVFDGKNCVADNASCRASEVCEYGQCKAERGRCVATKEDCAKSLVCGSFGFCSARGGLCVATSKEDCSGPCASGGQCWPSTGKCVAVGEQDCVNLCNDAGRCSVVDGECIATSAAMCRHSRGCALEGRCTLVGSRCRTEIDDPALYEE
jgi:hypothetical protein